MDDIHYLIRRSRDNEDGLIYPTEEDTKNYYGFGGFYLMGSETDIPAGEYSFMAVHGEEIVTTSASRYRETKNFFEVNVNKVGRFIFYAQAMPKRYPYVGTFPALAGKFAFRRMRSWKPAALDHACREHRFYFVGVSQRSQ
jgi:hypothetical protein